MSNLDMGTELEVKGRSGRSQTPGVGGGTGRPPERVSVCVLCWVLPGPGGAGDESKDQYTLDFPQQPAALSGAPG